MGLYKDELIQLHQLLVYLSKFLMDNGVPRDYFKEYAKIGINPYHIHRTKTEHKYAIFALSWCISNVLAENETMPKSVVKRLGELTQKCKDEI